MQPTTKEHEYCTERASLGAVLVCVIASVIACGEAPTRGLRPVSEAPITATDLRWPTANNSPMLVSDPSDENYIVATYRRDAPAFGCGLALSSDRGGSWISHNPLPTLPDLVEACYSPEVAFDRKNTLHLLFIGLAGRGNEPIGVYITSSMDRGRTFSEPRQVLGPERYQARLAIDQSIGERGRLHVVWLDVAEDSPLGGLPDRGSPILAMYSDDGGHSFSSPTRVSRPTEKRIVAPAVAIEDGVGVHVVYYDLLEDARDYRGLEGPVWEGSWALIVSSSSSMGEGFDRHVTVTADIVPPGRVMLIFTMPPPTIGVASGKIYVGWTDARFGDPDILVAKMTSPGSFSPPVKVNDDSEAGGRAQWLPQLKAREDGSLHVVFLDSRYHETDRFYDAMYASLDEGLRVTNTVRLTSRPSRTEVGQRYAVPSAAGLFDLGSRLAIFLHSRGVLMAWVDTRNTDGGVQQDLRASSVIWSER